MSESERDPITQEDPYFQHDLLIGDITLKGEPYGLRLRLHETEERFRGREELFRLQHRTGTRRYFHAKPYVLEPEFTLGVELSPTPRSGVSLGEVTDSTWEGMRHREIGEAQAWYYPADRALVIWECFLLDPYMAANPSRDMSLHTLWTGFERTLLERMPQPERIVTTWEDTYPREQWADFLITQGYQPATPATFVKRP